MPKTILVRKLGEESWWQFCWSEVVKADPLAELRSLLFRSHDGNAAISPSAPLDNSHRSDFSKKRFLRPGKEDALFSLRIVRAWSWCDEMLRSWRLAQERWSFLVVALWCVYPMLSLVDNSEETEMSDDSRRVLGLDWESQLCPVAMLPPDFLWSEALKCAVRGIPNKGSYQLPNPNAGIEQRALIIAMFKAVTMQGMLSSRALFRAAEETDVFSPREKANDGQIVMCWPIPSKDDKSEVWTPVAGKFKVAIVVSKTVSTAKSSTSHNAMFKGEPLLCKE